MNEYIQIIDQLGVPVVTAIGFAYGCVKLVHFLQTNLLNRIKELKTIIVGESADHGLINKINKLENILIKLDTRVEMIYTDMELNEKRRKN